MLTEVKLKKLLDFGFITEEEQKRIIAKMKKNNSPLEIKNDILAVLERDIRDLEVEEKQLETEKIHLEKEIAAINKKIMSNQRRNAKEIGKRQYSEYMDFKKKNDEAQKLIVQEIKRTDRKVREEVVTLKNKIEHLVMGQIRSKLK